MRCSPSLPCAGSVLEEPLLCREAEALVLERHGRGTLRLDRETEHARVRGHTTPGRATEQSVHRLASGLAAQVPERVVDGADRVGEQPRPAVAVQTQHLVVDELGRKGIRADEQCAEIGGDQERLARVDGPVVSRDPLVRNDLHVSRAQLRRRVPRARSRLHM